jgi:hypothetical protein
LNERVSPGKKFLLISGVNSRKTAAVEGNFHLPGFVFIPSQIRHNFRIKKLSCYLQWKISGSNFLIAKDTTMRAAAIHDEDGNN